MFTNSNIKKEENRLEEEAAFSMVKKLGTVKDDWKWDNPGEGLQGFT